MTAPGPGTAVPAPPLLAQAALTVTRRRAARSR